MRLNKFGIFILFFFFTLLACKEAASEKGDLFSKRDSTGINKAIKPAPTNAVMPDTPIKSSFDDPVAVANNKYSHFDQILIKDLCNKFWGFDMGIDGSKSLSQVDMPGFWLQFFPDGKYQKGSYEKVTAKGNYTVDFQGMTELIPDDPKEKRSEWQLKFNNDVLILIGTPKYKDNQVQMKLSRISVKPKKG
ncbi:MAG: hypothetical protein IPL56_07285 [Saprospiraceae bacterium]|jgi:hypothetical protein|nr:hypothetical protein [Saprospiraceae bacterium]MBK6816081.1 hypothetical protein [Saprospiraceae bacterium]MBK7437903.1 hypothetical protein [Saprospiraceae bacterium]MBK8512048.1 hypothetical protein [Saprospiraceae bacterium]MBK8778469.1 hypothetical protein [Saprospiraceae bacterium]